MRVLVAHGPAVLVAAALVAGCGGGNQKSNVFTLDQASQIVDMRPSAPGWTWPRTREKSVTPDSSPTKSSDPLLAEFRKRTAGLVDLGEAASHWQDGDKLAHLDVGVYQSASDAHKALTPFNAFSLGWARRTGQVTSEGKIAGLGEEAWLLRVAGGTGPEVTYHWRRGNLLLEAHMHCFGLCPPNLAAAARAWAGAIDARARALS
jgi:hypothetical protein